MSEKQFAEAGRQLEELRKALEDLENFPKTPAPAAEPNSEQNGPASAREEE